MHASYPSAPETRPARVGARMHTRILALVTVLAALGVAATAQAAS
jgi:hypothetical protein